ncbi:MAG: GTP-binding protein [Lachnospiraceae bacterium]|nr:GTP-binding protein [Lachnospiraceae bacterium]
MKRHQKTKIPVVLITGYLGSGKTTLLNELLLQEKRKVALIVNDMGSVNVDAKLLRSGNIAEKDTKMIELSNGCICCTLREEFMQEVEKLSVRKDIEAVFVEASGVSDPASVAEAFLAYQEMTPDTNIYLSSILTVVDADRIYREFLEQLEEKAQQEEDDDDGDDPDIINLVMDQIEFCNLIVLNKCDLLTADQIGEVRRVIRQLQPEAEIIQSIRGKVNADRILQGRKFDYGKAMNSSLIQKALKNSKEGGDYEGEYGIASFVYEQQKPFDRDRFMKFIEEQYPAALIRAKGYLWFSDDAMHVQLFEQAGRNASVTEFSNWVAAFEEKDRQEVFENYPEVLEEWDETYGDRMNQIVFIGKGYDREEICRSLDGCIEEKEIALCV